MIADFLHYYRLDLADVLRPDSGLSPRRALALVRQLPPESATAAAVRGGPQYRGWGPDRYLLALLVDAVREHTFAFVAANSRKKPTPPRPVARPDDKNTNPRSARSGGPSFRGFVAAQIAALRNRAGGGGDGGQ